MKSSLKTLAMWLIIGIIFIVVISSILEHSDTKMTYSELMTKIENAEVKNVELTSDGTKAYVILKGTNTKKEVVIPSLDSFMDNINKHLVSGNITLEEKSESIIMTVIGLLSPFGILIIFLLFLMLFMNGNSQGRKQNNVIRKKQSKNDGSWRKK